MSKIYNYITNLTAFKLFSLIMFLLGSVYCTNIIYQYGRFVIVGWGVIIICALVKKEKIKLEDKSKVFLWIFIIGNIITILLNIKNNALAQVFVLLNCCIYFLLFFSTQIQSKEQVKKDLNMMQYIIISVTLLLSIISLVLFVEKCDITYTIRGDNIMQLEGLYNGNATCGEMSSISLLLSLGYLFIYRNDSVNVKKIIIAINIIVQFVVIALANSITPIIALRCAMLIFAICFVKNNIGKHKSIYKKIVVLALGIFFLIATMTDVLIKEKFYDFFFKDFKIVLDEDGYAENVEIVKPSQDTEAYKDKEDDNIVEAGYDRPISEAMKTGTGRWEIWKAGINLWKEKPLFGIGYGNFHTYIGTGEYRVEYSNIHNGYLEILVANGLVGALSIGAFGLWQLIKIIRASIKSRDMQLDSGFALLTFLLVLALAQQTFILDRGISPMLICIYLGYCSCFYTKNHRSN